MPPAAYPTPPARAPRWLFWLLPSLRGVETNPLFIRLTGQGFGRRARFRSPLPPEFKRKRSGFLSAIGSGPALLILGSVLGQILFSAVFTPYFITGPNPPSAGVMIFFGLVQFGFGLALLFGIPLFLFRLAGTGSSAYERLFIENAGREPWGQDLALSMLAPAEIESAVVGAAAWRAVRSAAFRALIVLAAVGALLVFLAPALGADVILQFCIASFAAALFLAGDLLLYSLLRLGVSIGSIPSDPRKEGGAAVSIGMEVALMHALVHAPGVIVCIIAATFGGRLFASWYESFFGWLAAVAVVCLPGWGLGLMLTRGYLQYSAGNLGRVMHERVRLDTGKARPEA